MNIFKRMLSILVIGLSLVGCQPTEDSSSEQSYNSSTEQQIQDEIMPCSVCGEEIEISCMETDGETYRCHHCSQIEVASEGEEICDICCGSSPKEDITVTEDGNICKYCLEIMKENINSTSSEYTCSECGQILYNNEAYMNTNYQYICYACKGLKTCVNCGEHKELRELNFDGSVYTCKYGCAIETYSLYCEHCKKPTNMIKSNEYCESYGKFNGKIRYVVEYICIECNKVLKFKN